jgi:hypothetical protein
VNRVALPGGAESDLVGRGWKMALVEGLLDRAIDGHGVVGSPGIGKRRLVHEVSAMAGRRGVDVFRLLRVAHQPSPPFDRRNAVGGVRSRVSRFVVSGGPPRIGADSTHGQCDSSMCPLPLGG